jgi:hypothetical protein
VRELPLRVKVRRLVPELTTRNPLQTKDFRRTGKLRWAPVLLCYPEQ